MIEIPLTDISGTEVTRSLVDDEGFALVSKYTWHLPFSAEAFV